ncbi:hypothetical protein [Paraburkholderia saeva]|uniref:Uncharacterized protein n=1 Tax=Paraburkholderia saeva TaxID=2777537 RepID=A0A9N8X5G5_9BURK|nr:hypothetical protein [Paraburkholderia saeva]CAG4914648.1 hypothetical protein R52603_04261 [Paraburkholderia saeva]CAG4918193.1 hypothetical protein R70241_04619 [Paraburkholderia saeva]CAG4922752.1 hypothetical protein LMG31841_05220 [Paraburkholderia saeva]
MKRTIRFTALSLMLMGFTCGALAAQRPYSPLQSIEQSWITASVQRSDSPLGSLIEASFIGFTPDGASRPKPRLLIAAPAPEQLVVRIAGLSE